MPTGAIFFPSLTLSLSLSFSIYLSISVLNFSNFVSQFLLSQLNGLFCKRFDLPLIPPPLMMKREQLYTMLEHFWFLKYDGLYDRQPSEWWNLSHAVMRTAPSPPPPLPPSTPPPSVSLCFTLSLLAFIPHSPSSFHSPLQSQFVSLCVSSSSSLLVFFLSELCSTPQPSPDCLFFSSFFLSLCHHSCPSEENFLFLRRTMGVCLSVWVRVCVCVCEPVCLCVYLSACACEGMTIGSAKSPAINLVYSIPRLLEALKGCSGTLQDS